MIRQVLVIVTGFLFTNAIAQDVTNAYIKKIEFRWNDIQHNTSCGGDPGNESAEWKIRPYLDDDNYNTYADFHSTSSENSNSVYECDPFEYSDVDGDFSVYNDYGVFYSVTNTNYAHIAADYRIFLVAWESDGCGPTFEYNTGCVNSDDCPWGNDFTKYITVDLAPGPGRYNGVWYESSIVSYRGSSNNLYNRYSIDRKFSISSWKGNLSTPFEFGTLDANGCFTEKNHYFNTDDDGRSMNDVIYYTFTLAHKRSIKIDWSTNSFSSNPSVVLMQTFGINESSGGGTNQFKEYYNLDPGTYKIKIDLGYPTAQTAHSTYRLNISNSTVSTPTSVIHYWNGSKNDNWFEPCNWSTKHVPDNDNDVIIPYTTNKPVIYSAGNSNPDNANGRNAGEAYCNSIDIETSTVPPLGQSTAKVTIWNTAILKVNEP